MPFTVEELLKRGVPLPDACMIVWPTPEEQFAEYVRTRTVPHGGEVHHFRDESRH